MGGPLRLTKFFLRKWYYLDSNISNLSEVEEIDAKILYSALKHLTKDERKFLADKYRVSIKPFVTDAAAAVKCGMDIKDYERKRILLEEKLSPFIKLGVDKYKSKKVSSSTIFEVKARKKRLKG